MQFYIPLSDAIGHEGAFILFGSGLLVFLIILGPCGLMINIKGLSKEQVNEKFKNFRWFNKTKQIEEIENAPL